jgi:biotin carboxyl carrier protein
MRKAIAVDAGGLGAPTVGIWVPVSSGSHVSTGPVGLLGEIRQNGRVIPVYVPDATQEFWVSHCPSGTWVSYGQVLVVPAGSTTAQPVAPAQMLEDVAIPDGCVPVRAETDGTLYLRPDPSASAFVEEGERVEPNAVLALIEVMKTFSPVRASHAGTIRRVLTTDGASVEAGDVVFLID